MNFFVDTCFLMSEAGRRYLLASGMRFSVIRTVKKELEKLAARDKNVKAAQEALSFMAQHAELFELCEQLPEERDILVSNREGQEVLADSVFRRIAIRCADEQVPVHFLTADSALAEVLRGYAERITYLERQGGLVRDWREHRTETVPLAEAELAVLLKESDVVLSSSGLRSPFLRQFLLNVQHLAANHKRLRPILHELSQAQISADGHLSLELLELLESSEVVKHCGCETPYRSETAMLDALYYARSAGRRVTVIVSGWDDVVQRYDARSHAAEPGADAVNFRVISPTGGLVPLLNAWQLRKLRKPEIMTFPLAPIPASAEQESEPHVDVEAPDVPHTIEEEVSSIGSQLAQLVKNEHTEAVWELVGDSQPRLSLAILHALRWGRLSLLQSLTDKAEVVSAYCFDNWFKKSPRNPDCMTGAQLLADDTYYAQLRIVIRKSKEFSPDSPSIRELATLVSQGEPEAASRAKAILEILRARGVVVDEQQVLQKPEKEPSPIDCRKADAKYNHLFHQQMDKMKMDEFVAELRKTYRPVDWPSIFTVAIKVARRRNKPAMVTALLNQISDSVPAYCFENWFARSKTNAESPRARDLLLRKSFFDITKRIIARSEDLSSCRPSMQVLLTLQRDQDETVRSRARLLQELAAAKGAPVPGKVK